jgi:hypothetical protein
LVIFGRSASGRRAHHRAKAAGLPEEAALLATGARGSSSGAASRRVFRVRNAIPQVRQGTQDFFSVFVEGFHMPPTLRELEQTVIGRVEVAPHQVRDSSAIQLSAQQLGLDLVLKRRDPLHGNSPRGVELDPQQI